ncbi:hypothetical protein ACFYM0_37505 [Streptomyces sp. NPDC006487]|uniref:hypothetical protein n=1 Tax=Streptomyces sp. NPDC006487 TaxID=3364748 RepID=UPI00368D425C
MHDMTGTNPVPLLQAVLVLLCAGFLHVRTPVPPVATFAPAWNSATRLWPGLPRAAPS